MNRIYSALAAVIQQHPILSAIPVDETPERSRFLRLPHVDLGRLVKCVFRKGLFNGNGTDHELDELLEIQLNIPFEIDNGPLPFWRLFLLSSHFTPNEIVVTIIYHHGIADGMSGAVFHKSFLSALRAEHGPLESLEVRSPEMPLLPNLELVHKLDDKRIPERPFDQSALWNGKVMQSPVIGRFRSTVITKLITDQLLQRCKVRKTTVTAVIQVILAVSLFRVVPNHYTILRSVTPVNSRRWLSPHINQSSMGVFIDSVDDIYHREDLTSFSWSDAQAARETISEYLDAGGKYLEAAFLRHVPKLNYAMVQLLGKKRSYSFEVSNLGYVGAGMREEAQGSDWKSGRMVFSRSATVSSSALGCAVITGADGCLVLGYNWQVGIVDDGLVEKVIKGVEEEILKLAQ
jgi:hypothetical protein